MTDGIVVARITIVRVLTEEDLLDHVDAVDGDGNLLPVSEALGIMWLGGDTLIRERMRTG